MIFKERLQQAMDLRGIKPADLARITGIGEGAISQYRKGAYKAGQRNLEKLSQALNVPLEWLIGMDNSPIENFDQPKVATSTAVPSNDTDFDIFSIPGILPLPKMVAKPLIGTIACGTPILAVENIADHVMVPEDIRCDFVLRCKGDSMINACIMDGSLVYIREQPDVENGEIAAVRIGEDATLKRVYKTQDAITLMAENNKYAPLIFTREAMNDVNILGRVVAWINFL
ncbi:MAG: helix-turn-helix domain-containing protein [Clostridia bacterium]|nr:helix-turn-helix domain-containing protein [Clostridia bacterium]